MTQDALFEISKELHRATKIYRKNRDEPRQTARILILVKARPEPSIKYGDTVCVAGIRVDTDDYRWVRLFPIPFRSLEQYQQFSKYTFIKVPIVPARSDFRAESYNPERDNLFVEPGSRISNTTQRMEYVEPLISDLTMCEILTIARSKDANKLYPSLAVIQPSEIMGLDIKPFKGWTQKQKNAIVNSFNQGDLLGPLNNELSKTMLEEPRFATHMVYNCGYDACQTHTQLFLDWELEAFTRRLRDKSDKAAISAIQKRWSSVLSPEKKPLLYVGNQQKATLAYSVLGVQRSK